MMMMIVIMIIMMVMIMTVKITCSGIMIMTMRFYNDMTWAPRIMTCNFFFFFDSYVETDKQTNKQKNKKTFKKGSLFFFNWFGLVWISSCSLLLAPCFALALALSSLYSILYVVLYSKFFKFFKFFIFYCYFFFNLTLLISFLTL